MIVHLVIMTLFLANGFSGKHQNKSIEYYDHYVMKDCIAGYYTNLSSDFIEATLLSGVVRNVGRL